MYKLGRTSLSNLRQVHPNMILVVSHAINLTEQDFIVYDGARTMAEQREYVRRKVSKTLHSRHLIQKDGFGHAVDLVPWINSSARWEWGAIPPIAVAMAKAAEELDIEIIWGGVWDKVMSKYPNGTPGAVMAALEAYKKRHPGDDFLDGPHFELA